MVRSAISYTYIDKYSVAPFINLNSGLKNDNFLHMSVLLLYLKVIWLERDLSPRQYYM